MLPTPTDGVLRVANTLLEISHLPHDHLPPKAHKYPSRRRDSISSTASSSGSSLSRTTTPEPPGQFSAPIRRLSLATTTPPASPSAGRSGSKMVAELGIGLGPAEEGPSNGSECSPMKPPRLLTSRRRVSNESPHPKTGGNVSSKRATPPSPLSFGSHGRSFSHDASSRRSPAPPSSPRSQTTRQRPPSTSASASDLKGQRSSRHAAETAPASAPPRPPPPSPPPPHGTSPPDAQSINSASRARTPSLSGGTASDPRGSVESHSSYAGSVEDLPPALGGLVPVVEIVRGEIASVEVDVQGKDEAIIDVPHAAGPSSAFYTQIDDAEERRRKARQNQLGDLGARRPERLWRSSSASPPSPPRGPRPLNSTLRPSSPSTSTISTTTTVRPLGVRRVSPSNLQRSNSLALGVAPPGEESRPSSALRRHIPKRGASLDLTRRSSSVLSLPELVEGVALPDVARQRCDTSVGLDPSLNITDRPPSPAAAPSTPETPEGLPSLRRHLTQPSRPHRFYDSPSKSPPPALPAGGGMPFPAMERQEQHTSRSVPPSPSKSRFDQYSFQPQPQSATEGRSSVFLSSHPYPDDLPLSTSTTSILQPAPHGRASSRPPSSRQTKFVIDDAKHSAERAAPSASSSTRPSLTQNHRAMSLSEEGRFGRGMSSSGREASLIRGSATRHHLVVREEGRPSITYVRVRRSIQAS